jgi:hypothetical protein
MMRATFVVIEGICMDVECREGRGDILRAPDLKCHRFAAKRAGRGLQPMCLMCCAEIAVIGQDCHPADPGHNLAQEFECLAASLRLLRRHARDVAVGPRQAGDESVADRIVPEDKDDRDDRCRLLHRRGAEVVRKNDVDLKPDELGRDLGDAFGAPF